MFLLLELFVLIGGVFVDQLLHVLGALFVLLHRVPRRACRRRWLRVGLRYGRLVAAGDERERAEQCGYGSHGEGPCQDRQSVPPQRTWNKGVDAACGSAPYARMAGGSKLSS